MVVFIVVIVIHNNMYSLPPYMSSQLKWLVYKPSRLKQNIRDFMLTICRKMSIGILNYGRIHNFTYLICVCNV